MNKRRKIRSLNRASKNIQKWKAKFWNPNLNQLESRGECYVKLWIEPWYNLFVNDQPKKGHRNEILTAMLDVYDNWYKVVKAHNPTYKVYLLLYYPDFIRSQILATKYLENKRHNESKENEPLFEAPFTKENLVRLKELNYITSIDAIYWDEEMLEMLKQKRADKIKNTPYDYQKNEKMNFEFWIEKKGCIWEFYKD